MPLAPLNDDTAWTSFPGLSGPAYLDTASIGLLPREVGTAVAACYDALGSGLPGLARTRSAVACTRILLAEEFGCTPADITFTSSTGEAINAVARAVPWQRGDEVLVLADEFPTTLLPWSRLPDVRLVTAPPGPDDDRLGALVSAIGPRTRLVAVSHVNSCTGTVVDLAVLGAACARAGALLLCDGAQSAGVLPVDLSGVDFFVATGYKWMLAGFGIAFLITKESVRESLEPTLLGHANVPPRRASRSAPPTWPESMPWGRRRNCAAPSAATRSPDGPWPSRTASERRPGSWGCGPSPTRARTAPSSASRRPPCPRRNGSPASATAGSWSPTAAAICASHPTSTHGTATSTP